ncbi:hypothetical protein GGR21_000518 [Dysgonomonas hofstadii]|uniref:DUF5683 domain-containing protein n=1 Tax=Dysgonomonas hofstadii TaxID=637886 RepID=A0A840CHD5_9BACT|nr:DUF5683 domain-containing protein [Dysgonomonas hofstadii]MBB4034631.1 hypothetical protein [Dysgonomonas hofstadii]
MRKGLIIYLLCVVGMATIPLHAQNSETQDIVNAEEKQDSIPPDAISPIIGEKKIVLNDSLKITLPKEEFKPDSKKAVIFSAILPGLGQIYNRKYWKLPLVYGGAIGLTYAITWNGTTYGDYKNAYSDLVNDVPDGRYQNFLRYGMTSPEDWSGGREGFRQFLKRGKDSFRRNRDLAIIVAVGVYALCMIDAYVDAQLYDFNMSPDLSMNIYPVVWGPSPTSKMAVGLQCSIVF